GGRGSSTNKNHPVVGVAPIGVAAGGGVVEEVHAVWEIDEGGAALGIPLGRHAGAAAALAVFDFDQVHARQQIHRGATSRCALVDVVVHHQGAVDVDNAGVVRAGAE